MYTWDTQKNIERFFIGVDPIMKRLSEAAQHTASLASKYPPYNIKKLDDNKYIIEMAVAGFAKQDIEVELADNQLVIKGSIKSDDSEAGQMLHQGLAMRPFTRQFNLADNIEIKNASLINGILKVALEAMIPEQKKPTKIKIND